MNAVIFWWCLFASLVLLISLLNDIISAIKLKKYDAEYRTFIIGIVCITSWSVFYYLIHN